MGGEKAPVLTPGKKARSVRKISVRPATLRLLAVFVASACGGRSALDDTSGFLSDDDDLGATGGRTPSGGRPPFGTGGRSFGNGGRSFGNGGRSFGDGGRAAGGAFTTGGESPAGGSPGCPFGAWGDGDNCQDWTTCEPGEYILDRGSNVTDRVCAPCPPDGYTAGPNQTKCSYSGCLFSELVVTPATPSSPASCSPDPDYHDVGFYYPIIGLSHRDARAYLALSGYGETELKGYDAGELAEQNVIPQTASEWVNSFATAPEGTTYMQGVLQDGVVSRWVAGYGSDLSPLWRSSIGVYETGGYGSGVLATDSHWISWQLSSTGSQTLKLLSAPHPANMASELNVSGIYALYSIAADDQETIWLTGIFDGESHLARIVGLAGSLELVGDVPNSYYVSSVTVTPSGTAYVVGNQASDPRTFEFSEVDANGVGQRKWTYTSEPGLATTPFAIGVDPGRALYIGFNTWREDGAQYAISATNLLILRVDLMTDAITTKSFIGPMDDSAGFMTVPTDGSVYVAGVSSQNYFMRRVY